MYSCPFPVYSYFERIDTCLLPPLHSLLSKVHQVESPDNPPSWCFFRTNQPHILVSNTVLKRMLRSFFTRGTDW